MQKKYISLVKLLVVSILLIIGSGYAAFQSEKNKNPELTLSEFISLDPVPTVKSIGVGMVSGLIFGIIDNAGLFFGMSSLDPFLPKNKLIAAGLGNTYSDALGGFLGTFCGIIVSNLTGIYDYPVWSSTFGIVVGCLIGLYIPALITGIL
tara:strand:+ start:440 stop:889 length:450 start_codon:yes stop_codon:yes gene_type:complete